MMAEGQNQSIRHGGRAGWVNEKAAGSWLSAARAGGVTSGISKYIVSIVQVLSEFQTCNFAF